MMDKLPIACGMQSIHSSRVNMALDTKTFPCTVSTHQDGQWHTLFDCTVKAGASSMWALQKTPVSGQCRATIMMTKYMQQ